MRSLLARMKSLRLRTVLFIVTMGYVLAPVAQAASEGHADEALITETFLWMAVILVAAKISSLVEKIGQPSVLGELLMGVVLGNLILADLHWFEPIRTNEIIAFIAELGVVILLFQIGLESNIKELKKVGFRAFLVALIGVIVPFVLGTYVVGPWMLPGLDQTAYLFLGAAMVATSVGITARVFKDLGKLKTKEAQIVLGAAVFDDVMGLIILAIVTAIATAGTVSATEIASISGQAVLFLVGAIVVGQIAAPKLGRIFAKIQAGVGMKFTLAISFGLFMAYAAHLIGLAPIIGAFAAGLILDPVHFRYFKDPKIVRDVKKTLKGASDDVKEKMDEVIEHHSHRHIEDLVEPIGFFLVPIFFVVTGMAVKLDVLFDTSILFAAFVVTVVAFAGKLVAGLAAGKVNKQIVGWGMVPRGEVGLIFAAIGKGLGVISDELFSIIIIMVIITTLATPPILSYLLKKQKKAAAAAA